MLPADARTASCSGRPVAPHHPAEGFIMTKTTLAPCLAAIACAVAASCVLAARTHADTPKIDTILYGASYYHEYMPYERLEKDIALMKEAGISVIRLGESTWTSWEPRDGEFQSDWMRRIIDALHGAGITVVLGTPTYSIPPWLYQKHPELLVFQNTEASPSHGEGFLTYPGRTTPGAFGPRQNMDITHPVYLRYAERIIRQVVAAFRDHPAVIGFQVDNETHPPGFPTPHTRQGFVEYLKAKFSTPQRLNEIWGLAFWGQLVQTWDEFPPIDGLINPGIKLEWERYQRQTVTDFLAWQAAIVREYMRPDQFVTHNFIGGLRTDIDQYAIGRHIDVAAVNPYHDVQDDLDGHAIALSGDLSRSLRNQSYLVAETNAQTIGWDSRQQQPPYDGQLRLSAYSHVASGANMVAYWHWHSLHYGQETYWKGVLGHDLEPNRIYREVTRIGHELRRVGPELANLRTDNRVAILYSLDSFQGIRFMRFSDRVNYMTVLGQMHRALYDLNVGVDFVFPQTEDLSRYRVLLVPPLYVADDQLLQRITTFVERGGHVLMSFKSGFTNEFSTVRWERAPGPLRKAAGFHYQEFSNLRQPLALRDDPFRVGDGNRVSVWAELLVPETATPLAFYDHPFFGKYPAITRNTFGQGTLTYEGTYPSAPLRRAVLLDVLKVAGLTGPDQELPARVRVRHGRSGRGKALHFYLNYSGEPQALRYPYASGRDVLSGAPVTRGAELRLAPWDLAIVAEE
jgi:beta-galactosidase